MNDAKLSSIVREYRKSKVTFEGYTVELSGSGDYVTELASGRLWERKDGETIWTEVPSIKHGI